jgi:hypothetical protein
VPIVTLLTDFGHRDYYVAAIKGVLLGEAPTATLADLGHGVAPGDIEGGAFLLAAAAPHFPAATVHLAVVDPGVGGARRLLAAAAAGAFFVAPDNGLLSGVLDDAAEVRAIERHELFRRAPSETFHGRDRLAPAAAWLARGEALAALGPLVDKPVRLRLPRPERSPGRLLGRVAHVDRFGNLITDLPTAWLAGDLEAARVAGREARRWGSHYGALPEGEAGLLPGSLGTLELCLRGASLAGLWRVERGALVEVLFR